MFSPARVFGSVAACEYPQHLGSTYFILLSFDVSTYKLFTNSFFLVLHLFFTIFSRFIILFQLYIHFFLSISRATSSRINWFTRLVSFFFFFFNSKYANEIYFQSEVVSSTVEKISAPAPVTKRRNHWEHLKLSDSMKLTEAAAATTAEGEIGSGASWPVTTETPKTIQSIFTAFEWVISTIKAEPSI